MQVTKPLLGAALLFGALAACVPTDAQETPTSVRDTTDVFDPAVADATPIPGVET